MQRNYLILIIIVVVIVFGFALAFSCESQDSSIPAASPELQQQRLDLINECVDKGIFYKVEKPAKYPHVWVTPLFNSFDFDNKEAFISVVYAYYISEDPESDAVILYDSKTGREIGNYHKVYGGLKLNE